MITPLPAVQSQCSRIRRYVAISDVHMRWAKRNANRRFRHAFTRITNSFVKDPESFDDECFNLPTLDAWDYW